MEYALLGLSLVAILSIGIFALLYVPLPSGKRFKAEDFLVIFGDVEQNLVFVQLVRLLNEVFREVQSRLDPETASAIRKTLKLKPIVYIVPKSKLTEFQTVPGKAIAALWTETTSAFRIRRRPILVIVFERISSVKHFGLLVIHEFLHGVSQESGKGLDSQHENEQLWRSTRSLMAQAYERKLEEAGYA